MRADLQQARVRDLLMWSDEHPKVRVVLVVSTELFTPRTADYLRDGEFTVLGEVTRVVDQNAELDLTRRTALGIAPDKARDLVRKFEAESRPFVGPQKRRRDGDELTEPTPSTISGPAIQLVPLAIFV